VRPDCDNPEKVASDALNGIVWEGDGPVDWANVRKVCGAAPRLELTIRYG
jgi:Holliday junction resolvase RusA-like endonuclease